MSARATLPAMIPRALAISVVLACGAPPEPAAPIAELSNVVPAAPAPVGACPDLASFDEIQYLRFTEVAHGHFGLSEVHADFHAYAGGDTFHGTVTATFRAYPDRPAKVATRTLALTRAEVRGLLVALRDGILTPPRAGGREVLVTDSSQSILRAIDASGPGALRHVQLFVDDAQTEPHRWGIRGCATDPPLAARRAVQRTVEAFLHRLGRDALLKQVNP